MCNYKLSKINAVRKGGSEAYSQQETCLKFSEAEGNIKVITSMLVGAILVSRYKTLLV